VLETIWDSPEIPILLINTILYFKVSSKRRSLKIFSWYLFIVFFVQILQFIINKRYLHYIIPESFTDYQIIRDALDHGNNLFLSHFYFIPQFILLSFFYRNLFKRKQQRLVLGILTLVLAILIVIFLRNPSIFYTFSIVEVFITSLPLVIYSIIHLYNGLSEKSRFLYINSGILIYLSASTLIFILGDYISRIKTENIDVRYIWNINQYLYIGFLIAIFLEWYYNLRHLKTKAE